MFVNHAFLSSSAGVGDGLRAFSITPNFDGKSSWDLDIDGTLIFSASGKWTIAPNSNVTAGVKLWGGGGGGGNNDTISNGGGGGYARGDYNFAADIAYEVVIGSGGVNGQTSRSEYGEGGKAGSSLAGSAGGFTGLFEAATVSQLNVIIVAGGGGGGGASSSRSGGAGGGSSGEDGDGSSGVGGSQVSGGSASGAAFYGGDGGTHAGGGGGGYYGGGGGSGGSGNRSAGGGGSSYVDESLFNPILMAGSGVLPGNDGDNNRGTSGDGGITFAPGENGRFVLI